MRKIFYISLGGGHPAVRRRAEAVCSRSYAVPMLPEKFLSVRLFVAFVLALPKALHVPRADVYYVTGPVGIFFGFLKKKVLRQDCIVFTGINDSLFSGYAMSGFKERIMHYLARSIDCAISISDMVAEDTRRVLPDLPMRVVYEGLIDDAMLSITSSSKGILCLGTAPNDGKGTSVSIEVFKRTGIPTYILGSTRVVRSIHRRYSDYDGNLVFTGWADPKLYMGRCSILLHPSRFDAGGNAVLEGMAAGLIPIVSHMTGNKYYAALADPSLVIEGFDPDDYARKVEEINSLSEDAREELSERCREIARKHTLDIQEEKFKEAFFELIEEVESQRFNT